MLGPYCNDDTICPVAPKGPYFITQVDPNATHNNGFLWDVNSGFHHRRIERIGLGHRASVCRCGDEDRRRHHLVTAT
jgi:hypothetical protein